MRAPLTRVTRSVRFSAAHRYYRAELSEAENRRLFGDCAREHGHGHNYRLDVSVDGEVDPVTGMVINLADLDRILQERVVRRFDHSFINYDVEHFTETIPTCENLALYFAADLSQVVRDLGVGRLAAVRVHESEDLSSEVVLPPEAIS